MYLTISIIVLIAIVCLLVFHWRKKKIICKICCMSDMHKCRLLNELVEPLGYNYYSRQDIFSSRLDAWQKDFGYGDVYDRGAPYFNMVFDSYPVYFDHDGKTWLIEFWKGQYGINTGAEIGIYHADRIIPESDYKTAWFSCAEEGEMLDCSFQLCKCENECICNSERHWWLTAFLVGCFSKPSCLTMESCISFPNREMLCAFVDGLKRTGYPEDCIFVRGLTVCFVFHKDSTKYNCLTRFWRSFSQWKNKRFCKLYLWVTRPFLCTEDRVLYLYYYLPAAFRKLLRLRRFNKRCHKRHRREG